MELTITGVHYQFLDGETTLDENLPDFSEYQGNVDFETINSIKYKTRYFKIKKEPSKFRNSNGNYIYETTEYGRNGWIAPDEMRQDTYYQYSVQTKTKIF